ncbi:DUF1176 domain-containing protein [Pelagibacterium sediminicola]|uniref:DUF1176 domain-containing protein n=1 Tax=Pelagibacterium sediminicola TaxID=2248761 RepID=UPI001300432A|nr:DUF1176 domain-containing protein [Pelagibacterium sediminicola]
MIRPAITGVFAVLALAAPASAQDAQAAFETAFSDFCFLDEESAAAEYYPNESWSLTWEDGYSDVQYSGTLHQFFCSAGAYNVNLVYYLEQDDDPFPGLMPVSFATPHYDVEYENDDFEGAVETIRVRGFDTQFMLTNPEFDPEAQTITDHTLWRGLGDAFSSGHWVFDKGQFVLKTYDVDATYDGEQNPQRIVEYK